MRPALSMSCDVIIVNYNAGAYLARCVESVPDSVAQIIVVDNDSRDDSLDLLQKSAKHDARLHIVHTGKNAGFASGCNIGISASTAEYLLFLNPDCVLQPGSLQCLLDVLQGDAGIGMVGGLLVNPDGSEQAGGRRAVPTPWRSFVRAFGLTRLSSRWPALLSDFDLHREPLPREPIEVEAISGALMLVRRQAMDDVGLWDEKYFLHCEDLDLCMRFRRNAWKIVFVPDARVTHKKGVSSRARPIFIEWHKHKGMMRFYRKFFRDQYPGMLMWLVAAGVWSRFVLLAVYFSVRRWAA